MVMLTNYSHSNTQITQIFLLGFCRLQHRNHQPQFLHPQLRLSRQPQSSLRKSLMLHLRLVKQQCLQSMRMIKVNTFSSSAFPSHFTFKNRIRLGSKHQSPSINEVENSEQKLTDTAKSVDWTGDVEKTNKGNCQYH